MLAWRLVEVASNQLGIGQGVDSKAKSVAGLTAGPNHLFIRGQEAVLVVLNPDHRAAATNFFFDPWHVTGCARHPSTGVGAAFDLIDPSLIVGRILIGHAVVVGVATETGIYRRASGVEVVRAVTRGTVELLVVHIGVHRQPRLARRHRAQALSDAHAVQPLQPAIDLVFVAAGARFMIHRVIPGTGTIGMARAAIDPGLGVGARQMSGDHIVMTVGWAVVRCQRYRQIGVLGSPTVAEVTRWQHRVLGQIWIVRVALEEFIIQRGVVVIVVTACGGAAHELEPLMRRAFFADVLMAVQAVVSGHADTHRVGAVGGVFLVTFDAAERIDVFQQVRLAHIAELRLGMTVVDVIELFLMAVETALLVDPAVWCVAGITGDFDLIVAVGGFTRQEHAFITGPESVTEVPGQAGRAGPPGQPGDQRTTTSRDPHNQYP